MIEAERTIEKLRVNEIAFNAALEALPDAIIIASSTGSIEYVNTQAEKWFGYERGELEGELIEVLIPKRFQESHNHHFRSYISNPTKRPLSSGLELFALKKDQSEMPVEISLSPLKTNAGLYIVAVLREITKRTYTEAELKESERRYRDITEAVTDYIFSVRIRNGEPVETVHGANCVAVTGYTTEEFEKDPSLWIRMVPKEDRDLVKEQISYILSGHQPESIEHRILRKDGEIRWVKNTSVPHFDASGALISYDGLIRDVSDRKKVEEALKDSEERYRLAISGAGQGLWDWSFETNEIYVSPDGKAMFGYEGEKNTFRIEQGMERIHPEDREQIKVKIQEHIDGKSSHYESEFRICYREGLYRWLLARGIAIRNIRGEVVRMAGTFNDTTQRKEEFQHEVIEPLKLLAEDASNNVSGEKFRHLVPSPEEELHAVGDYLRVLMSQVQEARTELEQSQTELKTAEQLASVGRLAASVAHEIRNPLCSLRVRLFSLQSAIGGDPDTEDDFQVISEEIERLENIVNDFLDFSRPRDLKVTELDLWSLIKTTLELLQHQFEGKKIQVIRDQTSERISAVVDSDQIKQVFINLLNNAIEAVDYGGKIWITVNTEIRNGKQKSVIIRFRDNGSGVSKEIQSRLFDPFFTTKKDGTGLGLCISAQIMERHSGRLWLEKLYEGGTTFLVEIPSRVKD